MSRVVHSIDCNLSLKPISQFGQTFFKSNSRFVAENFLRMRDICETIPNITNAAFAYDFGLNFLLSKDSRHLPCDIEDRVILAATYVEYFARGFGSLQHETTRARNVAHVNEVAPLFAILINKRCVVV